MQGLYIVPLPELSNPPNRNPSPAVSLRKTLQKILQSRSSHQFSEGLVSLPTRDWKAARWVEVNAGGFIEMLADIFSEVVYTVLTTDRSEFYVSPSGNFLSLHEGCHEHARNGGQKPTTPLFAAISRRCPRPYRFGLFEKWNGLP